MLTGGNTSWVLIVDIDVDTGALTVDEDFRDKGALHAGLNFDRMQWPHGDTGKAVVHGSLFGK